MIKTGLLAAAVLAGAAQYRPDFNPGRLKGPPAGPPNEVMVLGTPHLAGLPKSFRAQDVEPLVERLAQWRPTVIATENVSGAQCDQLRRYPARYKDTVEAYCWDPAPARAATGLEVPAATEAVERTLARWPATPSAAERRRLAALFLASGDRFSALVHWLRLPPAERRAGGRPACGPGRAARQASSGARRGQPHRRAARRRAGAGAGLADGRPQRRPGRRGRGRL